MRVRSVVLTFPIALLAASTTLPSLQPRQLWKRTAPNGRT